ncbi:MAG: flavodoxin, partial [Clostridia bacterium]|nr:flavodoxin [Clostridia bacterium]
MKFAVRYYTRLGNTQKLANAIAKAISVECNDISLPLNEKIDVLFLGCSYYVSDIDENVKKFI